MAILIETLRRLKNTPNEIYFVFSVQEELGERGATTATYQIAPDLGLAVDITPSGDTPKGLKMEISLGQGPAIKVRDTGMIADPRIVNWMVSATEGASIPHQLEVLIGGTTDARSMQISGAGVSTGSLSIPCRYVHTPSEMVDMDDVTNAVALLIELLSHQVKLQ